MAFSFVLLFLLFLFLSGFFAASETALLSNNPYTLDLLEQKGSRSARLIKRLLARIDRLLATIAVANTLVNIAAASVATLFFLLIIPDRNQAALAATLVTTISILVFGEINPKTLAAYHPLKLSRWVVHPLRFFMVLFYPVVWVFGLMPRLLFRRPPEAGRRLSSTLSEEEIKLLFTKGIRGMSSLRKRMIGGVLDIGARPVKEIIVPRSEVKALEVTSPLSQIMDTVLSTEYSRLPVYRGRLDNVEGLVHSKDIIPYLVDKKEFNIKEVLRPPLIVPESASIEQVLIQMKDRAVHLAFVVDEFGTLEGIVTLEDIIEEIVGEIQDESDEKLEEWFQPAGKNTYLVKGNASIKELCQRLPLCLPPSREYTTLAGFLFFRFERIPREQDTLDFSGHRFVVEKMNKRHISLVRIVLGPGKPG